MSKSKHLTYFPAYIVLFLLVLSISAYADKSIDISFDFLPPPDTTPPSIIITAITPSPTSIAPIEVKFTTSEDISAEGCSISLDSFQLGCPEIKSAQRDYTKTYDLNTIKSSLEGIEARKSITVGAKDLSGNEGSDKEYIDIDSKAPAIYDKTPSSYSTGAENTAISAKISDARLKKEVLKFFVDGTQATAGLRTEDFSSPSPYTLFSYTSSSEISDGTHTIKIEAEDTVGNKNFLEWSIAVDKTFPIEPAVSVEEGKIIGGTAHTKKPNPKIVIDYTNSPDSINLKNVKANSIDLTSSCTAVEGGKVFECATNTANFASSQNVRVDIVSSKATQPAQGNDATYVYNFIIDMTPPSITLELPKVNNVEITKTDSRSILVTYSYNEAFIDRIEFRGDITPITKGRNELQSGRTVTESQEVLLSDSDGAKKIEATIYDIAGNSFKAEKSITLDRNLPSLEITEVVPVSAASAVVFEDNAYRTKGNSVIIKGTYAKQEGDAVKIFLEGSNPERTAVVAATNPTSGTFSFEYTIPSENSANQVVLVIADTSISFPTLPFNRQAVSVIKDTQGPIVSVAEPANSFVSSQPFNLRIVTDEKSKKCSLQYTPGTNPTPRFVDMSAENAGGKTFVLTGIDALAINIPTKFDISCEDNLGNVRPNSIFITVDNVLPQITDFGLVFPTTFNSPSPSRKEYTITTDPRILLSVTTNEETKCRYSASDSNYAGMPSSNSIDSSSFKRVHTMPASSQITLSDGQVVDYYISCIDKTETNEVAQKAVVHVVVNLDSAVVISNVRPNNNEKISSKRPVISLNTDTKATCRIRENTGASWIPQWLKNLFNPSQLMTSSQDGKSHNYPQDSTKWPEDLIDKKTYEFSITCEDANNPKTRQDGTARSTFEVDTSAPQKTDLLSIRIAPKDSTIEVGMEKAYSVTATYNDNIIEDVSRSAVLTSSDETIADLDSSGVLRGLKAGEVDVTASYAFNNVRKTDSAVLEIVNAGSSKSLSHIAIEPEEAILRKGKDLAYSVTAHYSDSSVEDISKSAELELLPSPSDKIKIKEINKAEGLKEGIATITAKYRGKDDVASIEIIPETSAKKLSHIILSPKYSRIDVGEEQDYTVEAYYSEGPSEDVTSISSFTSSRDLVEFEGSTAAGKSKGNAIITAIYLDKSDTASIEVKSSFITLIEPANGATSAYRFNIAAGTESSSQCKWDFDSRIPRNFDFLKEFTSSTGTRHNIIDFNRDLDFIREGDESVHHLYVSCRKDASNFETATFDIVVDNSKPEITNLFAFPSVVADLNPNTNSPESKIVSETNEQTVCKYTDESSQNFENMKWILGDGNFKLSHEQKVVLPKLAGEKNYYVICSNKAGLKSDKKEVKITYNPDEELSITSRTERYYNGTSAKKASVTLKVETNRRAECSYSAEGGREDSLEKSSGDLVHSSTLQLSNATYSFNVECTATNSKSSDISISVVVDGTPPYMESVERQMPYSCDNKSLVAKWLGKDPDTGIKYYEYSIVESSTQKKVRDWTEITFSDEWVRARDLELDEREKYYFSVKPYNFVTVAGVAKNSELMVINSTKCKDCRPGDASCIPDTCKVRGKCEKDEPCTLNSDCQSDYCDSISKKCSIPSCNDGVKNGNETDVDCGGNSCNPCVFNRACIKSLDCVSKNCNGKCLESDTCKNEKRDGAETDVDCGGGACNKLCDEGKKCNTNLDCSATLECKGNICKQGSSSVLPTNGGSSSGRGGSNTTSSRSPQDEEDVGGLGIAKLILIIFGILTILGGSSYLVYTKMKKPVSPSAPYQKTQPPQQKPLFRTPLQPLQKRTFTSFNPPRSQGEKPFMKPGASQPPSQKIPPSPQQKSPSIIPPEKSEEQEGKVSGENTDSNADIFSRLSEMASTAKPQEKTELNTESKEPKIEQRDEEALKKLSSIFSPKEGASSKQGTSKSVKKKESSSKKKSATSKSTSASKSKKR